MHRRVGERRQRAGSIVMRRAQSEARRCADWRAEERERK
jgi:hypothetical protein